MTLQLHLQSVAHGECVTEALLLICHQLVMGGASKCGQWSDFMMCSVMKSDHCHRAVTEPGTCSMSVRLMVHMLIVVKCSNCRSAS